MTKPKGQTSNFQNVKNIKFNETLQKQVCNYKKEALE